MENRLLKVKQLEELSKLISHDQFRGGQEDRTALLRRQSMVGNYNAT